ncbi:BioY protein [Gracilibacillus halophilus YIM-C55.5]|uniref:Biotin transporter n=1 Tax=Gracilibacillus halophilus YIM-C55.5 TaxID=1308866 RepID=N4W7Q1_9BACI|nr:biotin transporter BioY [Gracilibacillus halophilus]ENH96298.1 BioY protein [Gracilibacillus halophilus YIM-C55.5]
MKLRPIDLTLTGMFAAFMAIGANLTSIITIGSVPITLQTFFCILVGLVLGSRLGSISMMVYAIVGLMGAPVFAQFTGGPSAIFKATFGFILSYIIVAYVVGKMVESNQSHTMFMVAAFVGLIINYVIGTHWMYMAMKLWAEAPEGFTYRLAWGWMLAPLVKDIVLTVFAGLLAPRLFYRLQKSSHRLQNNAPSSSISSNR